MTAAAKRKIGRPVTQPCGTMAGYNRHRYRGEQVCGPCAAAEREREAARPKRTHAEKVAGRKTPLQPCGTTAARQRHWRRNETCWVCWVGDVA